MKRTVQLLCLIAPLAASLAAPTDVLLPASEETFHPPKQYDIPLGHPDFYPSDERPIGWRGDRTGAFPGATGPDTWDAETGEGIAWNVDTPGPGFSQPIVVGEKVFVTCDPNWLVCYSVHDGKELWKTAIDHTLAMDEETRAKARAEIEFFDKLKVLRGRWSVECEDLNLMVAKAGGDMKSIWKQSPKHRTLLKPETSGAFAKLLADEKIKTLWERLYAEQEEHKLSYTSNDHGKVWTPEIEKRIKEANLLYDILFDGRWLGYCTYSWPTPCSDGKYIYVATANNAVAAVSVADGSIKWIIWDHLAGADGKRPTAYAATGVSTRFAKSPVLYKDYFVVHNNNHMRVYKKETGEKIWEIWNPYGARKALLWDRGVNKDAWFQAWKPDPKIKNAEQVHLELAQVDWNKLCDERWTAQKGKFFAGGGRATPEANSPCVVEVPLDEGGMMPVVYDGSLFLYRLEDGKVLRSDMPMGHNSSVVAAGNAVMKNVNNTFLLHLTAKDRDTVRTHCVHFVGGSGNNVRFAYEGNKSGLWSSGDTTVYHDGQWYNAAKCGGEKDARNATFAMSVRDGTYKTYTMHRASGGDPSFILVGRRLYDFQGVTLYSHGKVKGAKPAYNYTRDVHGVGAAGYVDLDANKFVSIKNALVDRRIARDKEYAHRHAFERPGSHGCSSSPYAQANRIFMRTKGILYCIGNPDEPFPAPRNCPPQGRVKK